MYYACIIGVNQEWPEQRTSHGDKALACCLSRHCCLPRENIIELFDDRATRSNVLAALENLLDYRNSKVNGKNGRSGSERSNREEDTLLFYYGGHGKRDEFCTHTTGEAGDEEWLKHNDIIELLERKFHGGIVWALVDCCHSGGFGEAVIEKCNASNRSLNAQYGCIMSTPAPYTAGEEWTMTECFIKAFRGELQCSKDLHYLSKTPCTILSENTTNNRTNTISPHFRPTFSQVIDFLSDEIARIKNERLVTLFCGRDMENGTRLNQPCVFSENDLLPFHGSRSNLLTVTSSSSHNQHQIGRDTRWMDPFLRENFAVNDEILIKWNGLSTSVDFDDSNSDEELNPRFMLGWFPGRILSLLEKDEEDATTRVLVEVRDEISQSRWTIIQQIGSSGQFCPKNVLAGLPFGFGLDPQKCATSVARLARNLSYVDTSLPPWTRVSVLWTDGEFYDASTLCPTEIEWEKGMECQIVGPSIVVEWDEDETISIVPMSSCIVLDANRVSFQTSIVHDREKIQLAMKEQRMDAEKRICSPFVAIMESFSSSGKSLQEDYPPFDRLAGDEENCSWEAYDAEDCKWLPVQLMNNIDVKFLPLEVLAYHMCYRESGRYSVVFWKDDSVLSVVPNSFLRLRSKEQEKSDDFNETHMDEYSASTDFESLAPEYRTCKDDANVCCHIFRLGVLVLAFGLGYLVGSATQKSRR